MADLVYLIRHGQSTFNAAWEREKVDPMIIDAPLSERGIEQAQNLRPTIATMGIETIIASPLTRALQTASFLVQGLDIPIHVDATHREFVYSSCDIGRSPKVLKDEFAHLDFDHLDDPWWWGTTPQPHQPIKREPSAQVMQRAAKFLTLLQQRPERTLAVVGHCTFFWLFSGVMLENCEILTIYPHTHRIPDEPPPPPGL